MADVCLLDMEAGVPAESQVEAMLDTALIIDPPPIPPPETGKDASARGWSAADC
jgi:hypothetical protein